MDVKRSINTRMWVDPWFETLGPEEKLIWVYLLTNQQTNMLGVYEISERRISYDTHIPLERLRKAFEGFERDQKALFIPSGYVVLVNWLKNQKLNPNMEKSCQENWKNLPSEVKKTVLKRLGKGFIKALQRVPKIEIEIEKEIEIEIETEIEEPLESGPAPVRYAVSPLEDFSDSDSLESSEKEKKKVAPKKKSDPPDIPSLEEFMVYAKTWMEEFGKDYSGKRAQLISKYEAWKNAGWKDGFNKPIKDWKSKIRNTEPHLKSDGTKKPNAATRQAAREPQPGHSFGKL